jgi:hypothetical protein
MPEEEIDYSILGGIDKNAIKDAEEYAKSYDDLNNAVVEMGDTLKPLLDTLQESNVLTAEQVEIFSKWLSLLPEIKNAEEGVVTSTSDLGDEYTDVARIFAYTWRAAAVLEKEMDGVTN